METKLLRAGTRVQFKGAHHTVQSVRRCHISPSWFWVSVAGQMLCVLDNHPWEVIS